MDEQELFWIGSSLRDLRSFPSEARQDLGKALYKLQLGGWPPDCKPLSLVGSGAFEIRVSSDGRAFRTVFVAKFAEGVYVLHAFEKKTRQTSKKDIETAERRYRELIWARELEASAR